MSFLFGKKSKGANGSVGSSRDLDSRTGNHATTTPTATATATATAAGDKHKSAVNGTAPQTDLAMRAPPPIGGVNGGDSRKGSMDVTTPRTGANMPNSNLYPWSYQELSFPANGQNPFPRYGAAANSAASKDGDVYIMGGLVDGQTVKGDLWMVDSSGEKMTCLPVRTEQESPGPRVGHASLLVGNAFIVFGGDTKQEENDELDDTLYLLNTSTKLWSRALPPGIRPAGRYGHTLNILGSRLYIFGGQNDGHFFNDLVAFDLNQLQNPEHSWEVLVEDTDELDKPGNPTPPARTNHTIITYADRLFLFGGTDGIQWFNDVWTFDPKPNRWSKLDCIGYIPQPREGHSAALVGDVMYIFGGRTQEGGDLGDLAAFRISSRRWYTFQNMGPSPSARSGHSMTAHEKKIIVVAGEPSSSERDPEELSLVYILDTTKIRYPNDSSQNTPGSGDRGGPGSRRPSTTQSNIPRGVTPSGPNSPATAIQAGSRLPKPAGIAPSGPPPGGPPPGGPPPRGPPPPRTNGAGPGPAVGAGALVGGAQSTSRSGTPTRGYDSVQGSQYGRPEITAEAARGPQSRSMSPALQARPPVTQQPPSRLGNSMDDEFDATGTRARSHSQVQRPQLVVDPSAYAPQPPTQQPPQPPVGAAAAASSQQGHPPYSPQSANDATSRSVGPALRTQDSATNAQLDSLKQELDVIRKKAALYESELALARKAGYTQTTGASMPDDRGVVDEKDKPLVEALVMMKRELEDVQGSVATRVKDAAKKVAEAEQQRDAAIKEAVYAKAKLAAHGGSQAGTPQLDDSVRDLDSDRSTEISRKLGAALTVQNELRSKYETLSTQHESEKKAREMAEQSAEAAHRRAADLEQSRSLGEIEGLRAELHTAQKTAREEATHRTNYQADAKMLAIERDDLKRQLETISSSSTDHEASLAYLRQAMGSSQDKTEMLENKLQQERQERESLQQKLQQLRAQHEERTAELESTSRRLQDAEELADKHLHEATTHKNAVMMGLKERSEKRSESAAGSQVSEQRITVMQQQIEEKTELARKSQNEADVAAEKLRSAEERIAGLETFQQQASRENLTIRKQLQEALRTSQALQAQHNDVKRELESHQRNASALSLQHGALKDLLDERSDSVGSRGIGSPETHHMRELESQLEESHRLREDTRVEYQARLDETEATYTEKLEQLEQDYQSAVSYVKGTEKMLKRMKDELTKSKQHNTRLEKDIERVQRSGSRAGSTPPAGWEQERARLQNEVEEAQEHVKTSITQLEAQITDLHGEREQMAKEHHKLSSTVSQHRSELEKLRSDNAMLESRAMDAENKVSLLLDQVESSVDHYRRQSRASMGANGTVNATHGHTRTASSGSNYAGQQGHARVGSGGSESVFSQAVGGPDERGSVALDNLASELENLRTQWEGTHRSYRMSNSYNLGLDRVGAEGELAGGGLSDSLANWRKRLDAEERSKTNSRSGSRLGENAPHAGNAAGLRPAGDAAAAGSASHGGMNMI